MIKYIVNKEKRTVVAVIEFGDSEETFKNSEFIVVYIDSILAKIKNSKSEYSKKYWKNYKKIFFPRYMSAKAKCNPEDEWDEEFGKRLARKRLVEKIHNYRSNSYKIIADMIEEIKSEFIK